MKLPHFYDEYHGHTLDDLEVVANELPQGRSTIYLLGDSTLDNKYWINSGRQPACNGYERLMKTSVPDVAYWMNREVERRGLGDRFCCVNAAIEESTLGLRKDGLLPHDAFVQGKLRSEDVLVVSMGGNDIALRPTFWTIVSMVSLLATPRWLIEMGIAPGLGHFVSLFRDSTAAYLKRMCGSRRPRLIVACMLYYLDMKPGGSWAEFTLEKLGYNKDPTKLQLIMREVYKRGVSGIEVEGVPVASVAMYEALDGADTRDYVQRVEPSSQGGEKLARLIVGKLEEALADASASGGASSAVAAATVAAADAGGRRRAASPAVVAMPSAVHLTRNAATTSEGTAGSNE